MRTGFRRAGLGLIALIALGLIALVVVAGILPRIEQRKKLQHETQISSEPVVEVTCPRRENPSDEVVLPGNMQAFIDSPIYARTNGYLKSWYHDIGARVKKGELLAVIESPEVDQQLAQAKEDLATAEANLKLAQITATRYVDLFKTDSVAKQDVDNAVQDAAAKATTVKSARANVNRLQQMVDFERIYAPFNGVITARNIDIGQLIQAGASGQGQQLFHIGAIDQLRVFINVPQIYSHDARPGLTADLTLPELPGRRFLGRLVRTADAIDPATRTLLTEVDVPNREGVLFPGAYTEVHFKIHTAGSTLIIPSASLIFRSQGLRVPVVSGNRVALVPVIVGRDFGNTIEVLSGLADTSQVVLNPPDSLVDGEVVRVVQPKNTPQEEE
jgi:RND family efflux transporter MFP subunit